MESIYYVMSFLCHRNCPHCYEDRFHPYHGAELDQVVAESRANFARIIDNLPDRMTYLDPADQLRERTGRIILAGGEILLEPVRESVLYPALGRIYEKYKGRGGVQILVQTTGDVLTAKIIQELLDRRVNMISVSGIDAFHAGLEHAADRDALQAKLTALFLAHGMKPNPNDGPSFSFFGATPGSWIGKIWPQGRAQANELSTATLADNFCNGWSGGLNFLQHKLAGSEVSIEPNGNVYPCCRKTHLAVGNLLEEKLESILDRLAGNPVYEAISMGHPERMGIAHGWSVETFLEKSTTTLPSGRIYQNFCIGCDAFHREKLGNGDHLIPVAALTRM